MKQMKNMKQIVDEVFDDELQAIRTVPHQNQEFSIAISHTDNDSAATVAVQETVSAGIHSCVGMRRVAIYGTDAKLHVSPSVDGDDFVLIHDNTGALYTVKEICAVRIKVEGENSKAVMQG